MIKMQVLSTYNLRPRECGYISIHLGDLLSTLDYNSKERLVYSIAESANYEAIRKWGTERRDGNIIAFARFESLL